LHPSLEQAMQFQTLLGALVCSQLVPESVDLKIDPYCCKGLLELAATNFIPSADDTINDQLDFGASAGIHSGTTVSIAFELSTEPAAFVILTEYIPAFVNSTLLNVSEKLVALEISLLLNLHWKNCGIVPVEDTVNNTVLLTPAVRFVG
jgi:hypothetical protein